MSNWDIHYESARPLRTLLRLLQLRAGETAGILFFFVLKQSPVWILPIAIGAIITMLEAPEHYELWMFFVILGSLGVIMAQNVPTHVFYFRRISRKFRDLERNLRAHLVRRLQQLSISFHDETESGRLQAKVLRDVEAIEQFCRQALRSVLVAVTGLTVVIGYCLLTKPWVALFFVTAAPVCVAVIRLFRSRMRQLNRDFRVDVENMSSRVAEMIDMTYVTRAHATEGQEIAEVDRHLHSVWHSGMRLDLLQALFQSSSWTAVQLTQATCLLCTGLMCWYGYLAVGEVVIFQFFFSQVVGNVNQMLNIIPIFAKGMESMRSLCEVLECPDLEHNAGKRAVEEVHGRVTFDAVDFRYREAVDHAVRNFSLDVQPGQCVAFVGESGSGKTTLMNLLVGFYRPTGGRILLDGVDAEDLDLRTWRRRIAVVSQHVVLFSGTVRDNICYGLDAIDEERLHQAVRAANLKQVIAGLPQGLDTRLGENGATLSGGQRQRVAIARALIRDPRIIILDEATSALDVISEQAVQEAIDRLVTGRTTFIVAHRLSTIRNADLVVVLKDGHTIELGDQETLLERPGEFARLKALQA